MKKMHLINDKGARGLGIQVTGGKNSPEEGNNGIFISHIMDDGAAARWEEMCYSISFNVYSNSSNWPPQ